MAEFRKDGSEKVIYSFGSIPVYVNMGELSQYPGYREVAHWHSEVELIAVFSGSMDFSVNGAVVTLNAGCGIFVNSKQVHYGFSPQCSDCRFICALIEPNVLCSYIGGAEKYISSLVNGGARKYLVFNKEQNGGGALFSAIEGLYSSKGGAGGELEALACSFHILYELYISCGADPVGSGADDYNLQALRRMIAFICSNYGDKIQLNDIARAGSICKSKCNGIFKQYLNTTPVNYLIDYRIQKAMELLSCTDMKITDVCFETGFLSVSYFIETFKRSYGYPPSRVRKKGRQ